jgi:hypothetical protein
MPSTFPVAVGVALSVSGDADRSESGLPQRQVGAVYIAVFIEVGGKIHTAPPKIVPIARWQRGSAARSHVALGAHRLRSEAESSLP